MPTLVGASSARLQQEDPTPGEGWGTLKGGEERGKMLGSQSFEQKTQEMLPSTSSSFLCNS